LAGVLAVDSVTSSVNNGQGTRFAGPPPPTLDGPDFGALSALETEFGTSQEGVRDTIKFVLNLSGPAPSVATINSGNVVLAFGSPELVAGVPEAGTLLLLGPGLAIGATVAWRRSLRFAG
jgi:hypothetical protein